MTLQQQQQSNRGVSWSTDIDQDGGDDSMSSNSTPVRTNSGRPPLPNRKAKPNRLPPSSTSSANTTKTQQQQQPQKAQPVESAASLTEQQPRFLMHRDHYNGDMIPPISLADTSDTSLNSTTSSRSLASVLSKPREAIRDGGEQWRKHGKIFRAKLLMKDEESGGNFFVLSNSCEIERYYDVAEKVLDQFLSTSIDEGSELTESYLVGNRLVKFLSTVLPTHKDYFHPDLSESRNKSQAQLVQLLQYMEQLALLIDEEELSKYILQDLDTDKQEQPQQDTTTPRTTEFDPMSPPRHRKTSATSTEGDPVDFPSTDVSPIQNKSSDSEQSYSRRASRSRSPTSTKTLSIARVNQGEVSNRVVASTKSIENQDKEGFRSRAQMQKDMPPSGTDSDKGRNDLAATKKSKMVRLKSGANSSKGNHPVAHRTPTGRDDVDKNKNKKQSNRKSRGTTFDDSREISRDLSREFDAISRREDAISSDWDAQFSEFGIHHTNASAYGAQTPRSSTRVSGQFVDVGEVSKDDFGFPAKKQAQHDSASGHSRGTSRSPARGFSRQQEQQTDPTISTQRKQPELGIEWSTNFHNQDPFEMVRKQKRDVDPLKKTSNVYRSTASTSPSSTLSNTSPTPEFVWEDPPFESPTISTKFKPSKQQHQSLVSSTFASTECSLSSSQITPPSSATSTSSNRRSSPNSVLEFHGWHSSNEANKSSALEPIIQVQKASDECSSLGSQEHQEGYALTGGARKKPLQKLKGCIKFLLD